MRHIFALILIAAVPLTAVHAQDQDSYQAQAQDPYQDQDVDLGPRQKTKGKNTGTVVFKRTCAACHVTGAVGAPTLAEVAEWQRRLLQGRKTLYDHAISGLGAMPAKGGNPDLTDAAVKAAVDFIVAHVTNGEDLAVPATPPDATGDEDGNAPVTTPGLPGGGELIEVPVTRNRISGSPGLEVENPYADELAAVGRGASLFSTMHCVGCHAPGGGGGFGPPLSDKVWIYGSKPADIYLTIAHGRPGGMPAYAGVLTAKDIWSLVAYVKTLQRKWTLKGKPKERQTQEKQEAFEEQGRLAPEAFEPAE